MATFYSNYYTATGITQTAVTQGFMSVRGKLDLYAADLYVKALATTSDMMKFGDFHSNARIFAMWISGDDAAAAGALNLGLHLSDGLGGAVIDADLFGTAIAKNAASVDALVESGTLSMHRGRHLWEMAAAGGASYTTDPQQLWTISGTPSTSFTTTAQGFRLTVLFAQASG
jgi:hypothetical protein